jgi:hypothetical protein
MELGSLLLLILLPPADAASDLAAEVQAMPKPIMRLVRDSEPAALSAQIPDEARLLAAMRSGNTAMAGAFHDRTRQVLERTVRRFADEGRAAARPLESFPQDYRTVHPV